MCDTQLQEKIDEWLRWDQNATTRHEIEELVSARRFDELAVRLFRRMEFGTAGLRSRMGAGYTMMNDLTIIQTGQGFLKYLTQHFGAEQLTARGIVLGYDARHNSQRFAHLTANIFLRANVPVYLFRQITPTPFVPYSILKYKCCAGVMVTASHNPKEDNGYKVYFDNGAQIIPPHDKGIADAIDNSLEPRADSWDIEHVQSNSKRFEPYDEVYASYYNDLKKLCYFSEENGNTPLVFTYTAMHGVGYEFSKESFRTFGLKPFVPVVEQVQPDPEFPTVKFPNPEEGKSSLDLAIRTANSSGSTVILANDPDADRLAIAEKQPTGEWKIYNGNEIGALLGWWLCHNYKRQHANDNAADLAKCYMLYSTVSSQILYSIAQKEGFNAEDTLTGFKWMGNRAHDLLAQDKRVLFSFEEAIGFMCGTTVLDKDGISAEAVMAEMAAYLERVEHRTITQQLDWIYENYGYHLSMNSYFLCYEAKQIEAMFERLRHYNNSEATFSYPETCGPYKIAKIRDLTVGVLLDYKNGGKISTPSFPSSKANQMITFYFENGTVLTIRTSGTEPKIKYYSEIRQTDQTKSRDDLHNELSDLIENMVKDFYQPEKNNFKPRPQ